MARHGLRSKRAPVRITEIRIRPIKTGRVRARVTITLDNSFMIRGLKVIRGVRGYFVEMPRRKLPDGTYFDFVAPITAEARKLIEEKILGEFEKITGELTNKRGR